MKKYLLPVVITYLFSSLGTNDLYAQFWNPFIPLLEQWTVEELDSISRETESLQNVFDFKSLDLRDVNDSLQTNLLGANPMGELDSLLKVFQESRDNLGLALDNINELERFELQDPDMEAVFDQFDTINSVWNLNLDSLGGMLDQYRDQLVFDSDEIDDGLSKFEDSSGEWEEGFNDPLKSTTMDIHERFALGDKHGTNMGRVLDSLLHFSYDLELAFGTFMGDRQFWWFSYPVNARAFRMASVPKFKNAWETRWSIQASYFGEPGLQENPEMVNPSKEFKALMYSADCAFMYNPRIYGSNNSEGFALRLYSSLGLEMGTYAPSYIISDIERTFNNVGYTTGFGPQIGAGLVIDAGFLTFYSYGTMAHGGVHNSPEYRYTATTANAGVRLKNAVNVLFTHGYANWGFGDSGEHSKYINYNRFTVGLILAELIRIR